MFIILILCTLGLPFFPLFAQMKEVSFYQVKWTSSAPDIDGNLKDPCWKNALVYNDYYEYWKADPGPSPLKTELRMLFDNSGVYLGIVNHGNTADMRRILKTRDDGLLWRDNCAELFFDPEANGIGYTKFTVNALGTQGDCRRQDLAVFLSDWSGYSWRVKTSVAEDYWVIEAFFPWFDLGRKAQVGSVWQFCHVRFDWQKNRFAGATSSPGGNYNNTDLFGWIYFSRDDKKLNMEDIVAILKKRVAPPWYFIENDAMIGFANGGTFRKSLREMHRSAEEEYQVLSAELGKMLKVEDKFYSRLQEALDCWTKARTLKERNKANQKLFYLKWDILIDRNFN